MQVCGTPAIPCGSGLAREGAGTFNILMAWCSAFAGKPAPTGVLCGVQVSGTPAILVGASLLAKGPAHSTSSWPGTPPSRAGSLPQGVYALVE
ncbi:hypothetical protein CGA21_29815 [Pseudomonas sp. PSB11]|nr:hypothetical protein [Pseudomonas sp. PSB11]